MVQIQDELISLYNEFKANIKVTPDLAKLMSAPLLLKISDKWEQSSNRILIIGQETGSWKFERPGENSIKNLEDFLRGNDSIAKMVRLYQDFNFSAGSPKNFNSPFWQAFRKIRGCFDVSKSKDFNDTSALWTNLFKMDLDGGSVIKNKNILGKEIVSELSKQLFLKEIALLQPTAVIFFTGPYLEKHLISYIPDIIFSPSNNFRSHPVCKLSSSVLPQASWRTYHPAYLRRRKMNIVDQIAKELSLHIKIS